MDRPDLTGLPANLLVRGRRVVVVGAGPVAHRKISTLLELGADITVIAPEAVAAVADAADAGRLVWHQRRFEPADLHDAWLVFTATGDPAVDAAVFAAGETQRVWVNSADDPGNCSFTLMSVLRRRDLVLAIGTGGRSPALAAHLRRQWESEIGPEYETLLEILADAREGLRAVGRSTEDANWRQAFDSGIVELVRAGRLDDARELLKSCL